MTIAAIVISLLALVFTTFSFWWMNWRKGNLKLGNIRTYAAVAQGNKLIIELPIIFFNSGALPVLVENLRLIFPERGAESTALYFNAIVEKLATDQGRAFATPFAVHPGTAQLKICEFQRLRSGFAFSKGSYEICIQCLTSHEKNWKTIKRFHLKVREKQVEALNSIFTAHDNEPQLTQS